MNASASRAGARRRRLSGVPPAGKSTLRRGGEPAACAVDADADEAVAPLCCRRDRLPLAPNGGSGGSAAGGVRSVAAACHSDASMLDAQSDDGGRLRVVLGAAGAGDAGGDAPASRRLEEASSEMKSALCAQPAYGPKTSMNACITAGMLLAAAWVQRARDTEAGRTPEASRQGGRACMISGCNFGVSVLALTLGK